MKLGGKPLKISAKTIVPIALLLAAVALTIFLTLPQFRSASNLRGEKVVLEEDLDLARQQLNTLSDLKSQESLIKDYEAVLSHALPKEKAGPALMTEIEQLATRSALVVESLQFGLSSSAEGTAVSAEEVVVTATFKGSLSSAVNLVRLAEKASRILGIRSIRISSASQEGDEGSVTNTVGFFTYFLPEGSSSSSGSDIADPTGSAVKGVVEELRTFDRYGE